MKDKIKEVLKKLKERQLNPIEDVHTRHGSGYVDGLETAINILRHEFEITSEEQ